MHQHQRQPRTAVAAAPGGEARTFALLSGSFLLLLALLLLP
jgi:hypothetical protein